VRRSPWQLTFCVALSPFPFMLSGKLGRLGNLLAQSYQQLFAKLFILLELPGLLEKLGLPFPNQIRLLRLELPILLEKLKLPELLKNQKRKTPFLNQIKKGLLEMLKPELLKFELLGKTQRLHVKLFLLTKQKLLLLTLSLLTLPNPKKIPPRHDAVGAARRHD
jgi:hypothetical protein